MRRRKQSTSPAAPQPPTTRQHRSLQGRRDLDPLTRLVAQVRVDAQTGCWLMTKVPVTDGYVQIRIDGKLVLAHRYAYALIRGPIPLGLELDHLCSVRACCNPAHLEPVTHGENVRRTVARRKQLLAANEATLAQKAVA